MPVEKYKSPIVIENVWPELDGGRHPVKREQGELVSVYADIYVHGHDLLATALFYRAAGKRKWQEVPMSAISNDRWTAAVRMDTVGTYEYTFAAWRLGFDTWRRDTERKQTAGQSISSDLLEGIELLRNSFIHARGTGRTELQRALAEIETAARLPETEAVGNLLFSESLAGLMRRYGLRGEIGQADKIWRVICDRPRARFGAWYEMFPRSQGTVAGRSATLQECEARLPEIEAMGFDVVYLPPIHPIGLTHRKGANNSLKAKPGDPGSPYAIGSSQGGHDAVEPSLGSIDDFDHFVANARAHHLEVALDFAINCSPDHPYVHEHPEWFYHRPDGSIKYAENPPKRYEDIYPLNFEGPAAQAIWKEMRRIFRFWADHGVRIFRVDNPHTKPMPFWEWLLESLRADMPDLVFLSEAFTRPRPMQYLAKIGFSQSYTYFTWRNTKPELTEYLSELALANVREYFRPNFFVNTPDILPEILQRGGRPAFLMRMVLAATLSPSWGMYNGFELCENRAVPGTEEYQDSEKYQFKVWDWDRPGNIKELIARVNGIRREHPALQRIDTLRFLSAQNPNMLWYAKATPDHADILAIAVNLDPFNVQEGPIEIPVEEFGIGPHQEFEVVDLLDGDEEGLPRGAWRGRNHHLRLDPFYLPAAILRLRPL